MLRLGSPFYEPEQVRAPAKVLRETFAEFSPCGLHIPLYGAYWALAVVSDTLGPARLPEPAAAERLAQRAVGDLHHYNAQVHGALFALPNFYRALVLPQAPPAASA